MKLSIKPGQRPLDLLIILRALRNSQDSYDSWLLSELGFIGL